MSDRLLVIKPNSFSVGITPVKSVFYRLEGLEKAAGLTPGLQVVVEMSPDEARQFAMMLVHKAKEAEV